jgi:hypothetical protein
MALRHILASEIMNKEALNSVVRDKKRVLVRSGRKTIGAFVTTEELNRLKEMERREDEKDVKRALKILREVKSGKQKLYSLEEVEKEFGIKYKD